MVLVAGRVGIDLVEHDEVRTALAAHGDRYLARLFTPAELACCTVAGAPSVRRLACRVAAKEAAMKVLAPAADVALPWRSIALESDGSGPLAGRGEARRLADRRRLAGLTAGIASADGIASAVVTAQPVRPDTQDPA